MLIGGDKTGNYRFYERMVPIADALHDTYLSETKKEGLISWLDIGLSANSPKASHLSVERVSRRKRPQLREAMTLEELRKARDLSQEEVAAMLGVGQPAVAKLEKRGDMHVSNLRRYIEALGGTLEIAAHFGNESVVVENIGEPTAAP